MKAHGSVVVEITFGQEHDGTERPIMNMHGLCTQEEFDKAQRWVTAVHTREPILFLPNQRGIVQQAGGGITLEAL